MQNAQLTTNCATWILKVDHLSISKQQKNFGVSKMQGGVTIDHMATRLSRTRQLLKCVLLYICVCHKPVSQFTHCIAQYF